MPELPDGVSQSMAGAVVVGWLAFGLFGLRRRLAEACSPAVGDWSLRAAGFLALACAVLLGERFLFAQAPASLPGSFFLEEVPVAAALIASLGVAWARAGWRMPGVFVTGWGGLLLVIKPILRPLLAEWGGESMPYGITSETHLFFLVPGVGLLVLVGGLLYPLRHRLTAPPEESE